MKIAIIDWRPKRRKAIKAWLEARSVVVFAARNQATLTLTEAVDLTLLHVGGSQENEGPDDLHQIIQEFSRVSNIIGYAGNPGDVKQMTEIDEPTFAVFPKTVAAEGVGEDFNRVLSAVLRKLGERPTKAREWLRSTVSGFDALLERKLEVLAAVLTGENPPESAIEELKSAYIQIPEGTIVPGDILGSTERLRKIFLGD